MKILSRLLNLISTDHVVHSGRKDERLNTLSLNAIKFIHAGKEYNVANLSQYGLGINFPDEDIPALNEPVESIVKFYDQECPVLVMFMHHTAGILGARIVGELSEFTQKLNYYFESELQGLKVRKMDSSKLKHRKEGDPHWFYADPQHELFLITNEKEIIFFQLNFQGWIIEMNLKGEMTFGEIQEPLKNKIKGSDIIVGADIKESLINMAVRFLSQISGLEEGQRSFIEGKLKSILKLNEN